MEKNKSVKSDFAALSLNIIACVLKGEPYVADRADYDWQSFIEFCSEHKILNIVSYGLKNSLEIMPENIKKIFKENVLFSMLKEAQRGTEIELLCDDFEANEIPHMLLKGFIIKNLYPQTFLRSMSDIDILVGDNLEKATDVILKRGFSLESEEFLHSTFKKGDNFYVELHKSLIDESLDEYYSYFGVGFERAKLCENSKYKYKLSKEDFYIFLIAHLAKHYKICGTGIRSVCDVFVYNSAYKNELNYDYIFAELDKIGLKKFEEKIRTMADEWFSGNFDGNFDTVGEYIISNGVHGKSVNHELNAFLLENENKKSRFRYILSCIFPEMSYMQARYPKLKKLPFLLPFYWIARIFSTLFKGRQSIKYRLKGVASSDKKDYERFDETGLR